MNVDKSKQRNVYAEQLQYAADEIQMLLLDKELAAETHYETKLDTLKKSAANVQSMFDSNLEQVEEITAELQDEHNWLKRRTLKRSVVALTNHMDVLNAVLIEVHRKIDKTSAKASRYSVPKIHPKLVAHHAQLTAAVKEAEAGKLTANDVQKLIKRR